MVCLNISPVVALIDERISITVTGLHPLQRVTVQAWVEEGKAVFSSCAHFIADQQGLVDITRHASLGGTYRGFDGMGLFWSLTPVPGVSDSPLLRQVDVTTPLVFKLTVIDQHIPFAGLQLPATILLATGEVERWYKHMTVSRSVVREDSLRGTLFLPAGEGPFPGVIDMFGGGGLVEFRAALLASKGFAVFALAYFGYDDLPNSVSDLDVDYFLNAVDWVASHPCVRTGGIGMVGVSKGGQLAFLLGMATDKVKAVVNINGLPFILHGDITKSGQVYWKAMKLDARKFKYTDEGVHLKDALVCDTEIIPAWTNNAKILYLCGDDDETFSSDYARTFMKTCPDEKKKNIELVVYPGAGHLIEPPYMPVCRAMYLKVVGMTLVMGGQPGPHAAAQEDAWERLLHFLHKHLSQEHHTSSRL